MKGSSAGPRDRDWLFGVLLIECINNPQPLVVMTKEPQVGFLHYKQVKLSGLPVKIPAKTVKDWQGLADYLNMKKFHHYCRGRVGTQFCSFTKKRTGKEEEWMAVHEGPHFDSFKKLCDVTEYNVDRHFNSWVLEKEEFVNIQMYWPVIVVQGELLDAHQTTRSVTLRSSNHIQFRRSVAQGGKETDYQIDIIRERFLSRYILMIDEEMQKTAKLLARRNKIVQKAIQQIIEDATNEGTGGKMRATLDL